MEVITVINQKGGVGKTTTAAALGAGLADRGYSVLLVDLDPQGNLSTYTGADLEDDRLDAMDVLIEPDRISDAIQTTDDGLGLIASTADLTGAETELSKTAGRESRLRAAFFSLEEKPDFAIIDTPPALGILTINALTASNLAIIPAQADLFSLQGITQLYEVIGAVKKFTNPDLKVDGILITRYQQRTTARRETAETLEGFARAKGTKVYKSKIRECTAIVEAQLLGRSIFDHKARSNAAEDYGKFVDEVLRS